MENSPTTAQSDIASLLIKTAASQSGSNTESEDNTDDENQAAAASREGAEIVESEDDNTAQDAQTDDDGDQLADDETESSEDDIVTLDDLAEMLDVPAREVYTVSIPLGGGNSATLGEMKDAFKWKQKYDEDESGFQEHRRKQENEILVARRQTEDLVNMLIGTNKIGPEDLAAVESINSARIQRENKAALAAIPTWSNPETRKQDFDAFVELGAEYGFSDVEIRNIPDHRILKMLYDFSASRRYASKKTNGKTPPKQTGGQRRAVKKAPTLAQRKHEAKKGGAAKTALVTDLLLGKVEP